MCIRDSFLYNTLESIYCLAQNSGDKRIAEMCIRDSRKARVLSDYSLTNLYNFVVLFSFSLSVGGIRQNLQRVFVYFLQ